MNNIQFLALQPFIPSGSDFEKAKAFFTELGFTVNWSDGSYAGLEKDSCRFILQKYDQSQFAENLMLTIAVNDVAAFRDEVLARELPEKYGIRIGGIQSQPYGKEVNLIDPAGVCWHFVE